MTPPAATRDAAGSGDGKITRAHRDDRRPSDFHRQLIRLVAELPDAAGAFLVRAVHDEARGWHRASEQL